VVPFVRTFRLFFLTFPLASAPLHAQDLSVNQFRPALSHSTANRNEDNRRQARALYGTALLNARNNRILEATRQLEEAW